MTSSLSHSSASVVLPSLLLCCCGACVYGIIRCPGASGIIDRGYKNKVAGFKAFLQRHSWTFGRPVRGFVWLWMFNALALILGVIETLVWSITGCINIITVNLSRIMSLFCSIYYYY